MRCNSQIYVFNSKKLPGHQTCISCCSLDQKHSRSTCVYCGCVCSEMTKEDSLKLQPEYILFSVSIADDKGVLSNLDFSWVVRSREVEYESLLGFTALNLLQESDAWIPLPMKHSGMWVAYCSFLFYRRTCKKHWISALFFSVSGIQTMSYENVLVLCSRFSTGEHVLLSRK